MGHQSETLKFEIRIPRELNYSFELDYSFFRICMI